MSEGLESLRNYVSSNFKDISPNLNVELVRGYTRTGGETYIAEINIKYEENSERLIVKACAKIFPERAMKGWLSRREILQNGGINLPKLKYAEPENAILVEEYIEYTLSEAYRKANSSQKKLMEEEFIQTYRKLIMLGFHPTSLHDVRSRGNDVVLIDMGEDLGAQNHNYNNSIPECEIHEKALAEFNRIISK